MERRTLLLTSWMFPLKIITWQGAVKMKYEGTVDVLAEYDDEICSPSVTWQTPAVIRLRKNTTSKKHRVRFSRINIYTRDNFTCQYCLAPDHKILTTGLRWVQLGDLQVGDSLVGFEEEAGSSGGRRFQEAAVETHEFAEEPLFEVLLEDGTIFRATKEHKWLGRIKKIDLAQWLTTSEIAGKFVPRLFDTWGTDNSREAGWLAGILDGEGWLTSRGMTLAVAQNPGLVLEHTKQAFREKDVDFSVAVVSGECRRIYVKGPARDKVRILGQVRPERLLEEFDVSMLGRLQAAKWLRVVEVNEIGVGEIVRMSTSAGTFVADGFPHHNCGTKFRSNQRMLSYDHVVPRCEGGRTVFTNIVTACKPCNARKDDKSCDTAGMWPLRTPTHPKSLPLAGPRIDRERVPVEWLPFLPELA